MSTFFKEEGETSELDMKPPKIKTENHGHTFRFRYGFKPYSVTCNKPMTVLESLQTNSYFKEICKKNQAGKNKEIVIRRELCGEGYRAAVTPHFPCCLLEDNELLDITFIKSDGKSTTVTAPNLHFHSAEDLISFYVKTRGDKNIRMVMKNSKLKGSVDYLCVYGEKGKKVKVALKRDGRFNSDTLMKGALCELGDNNIFSNLSEYLNGKKFHIIVKPHQTDSQESSQEMSEMFEPVKDEKNEIPATLQATSTTHDSANTQEKKTETTPKAKRSRRYPDRREIPNSHEILTLLREQHADLLKTLKERENLKNDADVKRFFREEYDKSAQSFSEVKKVKKLMELSDSVCQIRSDGSARGTGFLLFNKFVLTCAHVVGDLVPLTGRMKNKLSAAFRFEDFRNVLEIEVKEDVVAYFSGNDDWGNQLDFALLELSSDKDLFGLLPCWTTAPNRGGVCIIGHPGSGVKRMDPCFIIAKENHEQAAMEYYERNRNPKEHCEHNKSLSNAIKQCLAEYNRNSQIFYHSCFLHGSSGSPVFNDDCQVIGIHTGGYVYGDSKKTRSMMEFALPIFPVLVKIYIQCSESGRSDIVQLFDSQNFPQLAAEQLQSNNQAK